MTGVRAREGSNFPITIASWRCSPVAIPEFPRATRALCLGMSVLTLSLAAQTAEAQQVSTATQRGNLPTATSQKLPETAFRPDGPLGLAFMFDDGGKVLTVKDKNGREVAVAGGSSWCTAPDGKKVFTHSWNLVSRTFASQYLSEKLLNAQIVKREPRTDDKGETIGERIVALLFVPTEPHKRGPTDPHKMVPTLIRTDGTRYSEIASESMDDVLAFEKSSYNNWH
jgi:hypothetical protein